MHNSESKINGKSETIWGSIYECNDEFTCCGESLYEATPYIMIYIYVVVITVESKGKASVFCLKLHADENDGSIKWKIMSDPYFHRLCQSKMQLLWPERVTFYTSCTQSVCWQRGCWQRATYTTRNASLPNLSRSVVIRHLSTCLTKPSFTLPRTRHHSGL